MAARSKALNVRQVESWRLGIKVAQIRNRLQDHVLGKIELSATQVRAAEVLLRKVIPDLSSTEYTGVIEHKHVTEYSDAELLGFLAQSHDRDRGDRVAAQAGSARVAAVVHGIHDPELDGGEDPQTH